MKKRVQLLSVALVLFAVLSAGQVARLSKTNFPVSESGDSVVGVRLRHGEQADARMNPERTYGDEWQVERRATDEQTSRGKVEAGIGDKTRSERKLIGDDRKQVTGGCDSEDEDAALKQRVEELVAGEHMPDEVLVCFLPGTSEKQIEGVLNKVNTVEVRPLRTGKAAGRGVLCRLYLAGNATVAGALRTLLPEPLVRYAEPNYIVYAQFEPNDPLYQDGTLWGLEKIGASSAWDESTGSGVVVAVLDTGIDLDHEDLAANLWQNPGEVPGNGVDDDGNGFIDDVYGWDFAYGDNNPNDGNMHGTHCSGTIAAVGNNGIGMVGLAFGAKLMAVKVMPNYSGGTLADIVEGIYYAADNGADVMNCSWGGYDSTTKHDAIKYAYQKGCVIVAAAGNYGTSTPRYPAAYSETIAVGNSTPSDKKAYLSSYGSWLDVLAPGTDITSTYLGDQYRTYSGTSMAAPYVSGLAALILAKNPAYTFEEVRDLIRSSAKDLGDPGFDLYYGYGRIDAAAALDAAEPSELTVTIDSVIPGDGLIGPAVSAVITWHCNMDGTYYIEVGGSGVPGSGSQVDTGSVTAYTNKQITIGEEEIADNATETVWIIVDSDGEVDSASVQLTDDETAPSLSISYPAMDAVLSDLDEIRGTVSDNGGSSIARVEVAIRLEGGSYYNPGSGQFDSASPVWLQAFWVTDWSCDTSAISWQVGSYTAYARARDAVGNEAAAVNVTFSIDSSAPPPPPPAPDPSTGKKTSGGCVLIPDSDIDGTFGLLFPLLMFVLLILLIRHRVWLRRFFA